MEPTSKPQGHFGEQVAARIKAKGLTLRQVSDESDIALTTLHRRLNSASSAFTLGELSRIAALLGTTASALVRDFEDAA